MRIGNWPLLSIALGPDPQTNEGRGFARGIIAIGDIAFGFVALGGISFGGITIGGVHFRYLKPRRLISWSGFLGGAQPRWVCDGWFGNRI